MQSNTKIQKFWENREFTYNKAGHILNLTRWIRYSAFSIFKNVSIHWKKYVFHLDKWNFELIGILRAHNTDFWVSTKVLLTFTCGWLAKYSSSSFYSACGGWGIKPIRKFFPNKRPWIFCPCPNCRKEEGLF